MKGDVHPGTEAVAVLLHGASVRKPGSTSWMAPAPWRMRWFGRAIRIRSKHHIAVLRLRHPDRDWATVFPEACGDVLDLLTHIEHVAPSARVALVGHSNGGRVALSLSSDPRVAVVVALAPWITGDDRFTPRRDQPVLLLHGAMDHRTEPQRTSDLAAHLRRRGCAVDSEIIAGGNHAMLPRPHYWHRRVADFLAQHLVDRR